MRHFIVVAMKYCSPSVMFTFAVSCLRYNNYRNDLPYLLCGNMFDLRVS